MRTLTRTSVCCNRESGPPGFSTRIWNVGDRVIIVYQKGTRNGTTIEILKDKGEPDNNVIYHIDTFSRT